MIRGLIITSNSNGRNHQRVNNWWKGNIRPCIRGCAVSSGSAAPHCVYQFVKCALTALFACALAVLVFWLDVRRPCPARWLLLACCHSVAILGRVARLGALVAGRLSGSPAVDVILPRVAFRLHLASTVTSLCRSNRLKETTRAFSAAPARGQQCVPLTKYIKKGGVGEGGKK